MRFFKELDGWQKTALLFPLLVGNGSLNSSAQEIRKNSDNQGKKKYNVVFIISDDLNCDLGSFDDPIVKTPNLDKIRQNGVRFFNDYCQYPLSGPTRASFLTGYSPDKTKVYDLSTNFRKALPSAVTLPELFKNNGYYTARIGKVFHAGVPGDIGQDGMDDPQSWNIRYNPIGIDKTEEDKVHVCTPQLMVKGRIGATLAYRCVNGPDNLHTDAIGANIACYLIHRHKDKPFFIAMGFYRPHTPFVAPKKYFDMYPLSEIKLPYVPTDDWKNKPICARWSDPLNWGVPTDTLRQCKRAYYACISFMDAQIGKIVNELKKDGLADNTIIVFCGDNGYCLGQHGQWEKQMLFEHSARVPLIISVPGITKTKGSYNHPVEMLDIYPTIANLCNLKNIPSDLDGKDLAPLLKDTSCPWNEDAFTETARVPNKLRPYIKGKFMGRSVRTTRYRYTEWDEGKEGGELYDYEKDPNEYHNLYNNKKYAKIQEALAKILHQHYKYKASFN